MPMFFDSENYVNSTYALNIALENYYADYFFQGDTSRIVYSSTAYALRARAKRQTNNNLNLPFMNYKISNLDIGVTNLNRNWYNWKNQVDGIYIEQLGLKMRLMPMTVSYDATLFVSRDDELQFGSMKVLWDNAAETIVPYYVNIDDFDIKVISVVNNNFDYNSTYDSGDYLEKNEIRTVGMNMEVATFSLRIDRNICIPNQVLLDFGRKQNVNDEDEELTVDAAKQLVIDHFTETVTEV